MATVFVWENHFLARPWDTFQNTWTGHSSLCITDDFTDTRALVADDNDPNKSVVDSSSTDPSQSGDDFVSFWPGTMQNTGPKDSGGFTFNDGWKIGIRFLAKAKPSIFADVALEGYAPDHVVRITKGNVQKMKAKWRSIRNKQNAHYKFLRKNCSTIVAHVMQAGFPVYKNDHYTVWTPTNIRDYAIKLGTTMLYADFIDELENGNFATKAQLDLLRSVKRRSAARGTSGGLAKFA